MCVLCLPFNMPWPHRILNSNSIHFLRTRVITRSYTRTDSNSIYGWIERKKRWFFCRVFGSRDIVSTHRIAFDGLMFMTIDFNASFRYFILVPLKTWKKKTTLMTNVVEIKLDWKRENAALYSSNVECITIKESTMNFFLIKIHPTIFKKKSFSAHELDAKLKTEDR